MLNTAAQSTQGGLEGMVAVPTARIVDNGSISLGFQMNPGHYKFVRNSNRRPPYNNEHIYYANVGFVPRVNILLCLIRDVDKSDTIRQGIGDRSIQVSVLLFEEKKYIPSVVFNIADPLFSTNQYQTTNNIVLTKNLSINKKIKFAPTLGYGIPYFIRWKQQETHTLNKATTQFLINFFGGIQWTYLNKVRVATEYDGEKFNLGGSYTLFKKLTLEMNLIGMKYPTLGINFKGKIK